MSLSSMAVFSRGWGAQPLIVAVADGALEVRDRTATKAWVVEGHAVTSFCGRGWLMFTTLGLTMHWFEGSSAEDAFGPRPQNHR